MWYSTPQTTEATVPGQAGPEYTLSCAWGIPPSTAAAHTPSRGTAEEPQGTPQTTTTSSVQSTTPSCRWLKQKFPLLMKTLSHIVYEFQQYLPLTQAQAHLTSLSVKGMVNCLYLKKITAWMLLQKGLWFSNLAAGKYLIAQISIPSRAGIERKLPFGTEITSTRCSVLKTDFPSSLLTSKQCSEGKKQ